MVFSFSKPTYQPNATSDDALPRITETPSSRHSFRDAHHRPKNTSSPHSHAPRAFVRAHSVRMSATTSRPLDAPALSPQWCSRRVAQIDSSSLARCYLVCRSAVRIKGKEAKTFATRDEIIKEIIHEVRRHWRRNQMEMEMEMDARDVATTQRRDSTRPTD